MENLNTSPAKHPGIFYKIFFKKLLTFCKISFIIASVEDKTKEETKMFKCRDCGHIFEDGEQRTYAENHPYGDTTADEYFSVCPVCGGDYEETKSCKRCGGAFLEDELIEGYYCEECLRAAVDFDSFLDFATSGTDKPTEVDTLEDFVFTMIFGLKEAPDESGYSLKALCKVIYNKAKQHGDILMQTIFKYMDSTPSLWDYFAEYLHDKEVRK